MGLIDWYLIDYLTDIQNIRLVGWHTYDGNSWQPCKWWHYFAVIQIMRFAGWKTNDEIGWLAYTWWIEWMAYKWWDWLDGMQMMGLIGWHTYNGIALALTIIFRMQLWKTFFALINKCILKYLMKRKICPRCKIDRF